MPAQWRKTWVFVGLAVALTVAFAWLGAWQVRRLGERRAIGRVAEQRLALEPLDLGAWLEEATEAPEDGEVETLEWRRVVVTGVFDYSNEIVLRGRSREGTPGVHVVTPLRQENGQRPALLVIRGWLPAVDALRADLAGARPSEAEQMQVVNISGFALSGSVRHRIPPLALDFAGESHTVLAALDLEDAAAALPYAIGPIVIQAANRIGQNGPWPLPPPHFGNGPHLAYAIQWFCFALIALVGGTVFALRSRSDIGWNEAIDDHP